MKSSLYKGFLTLFLLIGTTLPSTAQTLPDQIVALIDEAADRYDLDSNFMKAIAWMESRGRADAVSPAGAQGVMQLMPGTAAMYQGGANTDLKVVEHNIDVAARHLRDLSLVAKNFKREAPGLTTSEEELIAAAYNAGWYAVKKYKGVPPFSETQKYVPAVMKKTQEFRAGNYSTTKPRTAHIVAPSTTDDTYSRLNAILKSINNK